MIRTVKRTALSTLKSAGVFTAAGRSKWRRNRLLILGYHGIAQHDEHAWNPALFVTPAFLESRLQFLRARRFNILPLAEGLARLKDGSLPERCVTLTFDDGYVDFFRLAGPMLRQYDAPATVYLTTYYTDPNLPIPGITAAYMIWMSPTFVGRLTAVPGYPRQVDLRNDQTRRTVSTEVGRYFTNERAMAPAAKHAMLERLADELGFDLAALRARRLMHLMTPDEVRAIAADGVDVQLHTHRHWVPADEDLIRREIEQNRARIETLTGRPATHLCYPNGEFYPGLLRWLRTLNIESATTCEAGLASAGEDPLRLPRFVDHSGVNAVEFEAWATGVGSVLPRRAPVEVFSR